MSKKSRETNRTERAAAVRRDQASRERNRKVGVIAAVVVLLAVIVGAGVLLGRGSSDSSAVATGPLPPASASGQALVVGDNTSAEVKVVVYEDFLCPYCRQFESATRSALHKAADAGTVQVEYRPFHLLQDEYSTQSLAAWSAVLQQGTPEQALRLHDLLYANQPYEQSSSKPGPSELVTWAQQAGVTDSSVLAAVEKASDRTFVDAADAAATKAGVSGTPTVFVNGKELKGTSVSDTADRLEKMISEA